MIYITTYTDASHCPRSKVGGWGTYIRTGEGKHEYSGKFDYSNSPEHAEFKAACNSLSCAAKFAGHEDSVIVLVTDCLAVKDHIQAKIKTGKSPRKNPCNKWLNTFFKSLPDNVSVAVKKVKAHSNQDGARSWVNNRVDQLAKKQMRSIRPKNWNKMEIAQ